MELGEKNQGAVAHQCAKTHLNVVLIGAIASNSRRRRKEDEGDV